MSEPSVLHDGPKLRVMRKRWLWWLIPFVLVGTVVGALLILADRLTRAYLG